MKELEILYKKACLVMGEDIGSKSRKTRLAYARFCYFYYAKKLTIASLENIGYSCGNRDHSTVLYGLKRFEELYGNIDLLVYQDFKKIHNDIYKVMSIADIKLVDEKDIDILKNKVSTLENENIKLKIKINKISSLGLDRLPDDKIELFRTTRLEPFLKMNV